MLDSVGIIELTSVGVGYSVQDAMLKAADVRIMLARTICSGKYIVAVTGKVAEATEAVEGGLNAAPDGVIDHCVISRIHPTVFRALGAGIELRVPEAGIDADHPPKALGVVETYSGVSVLEAADTAAKAANIALFRLHLAMAFGGKGFLLMAGSVSSVQTAVDAAADVVRKKGLLVSAVAIPGPRPELFAEYL